MRVGIDVTAVPGRPTGAGQYTLALITALAALDEVDLTLVCRRGDDGRWGMVAPAARVVAAAPQHRPVRLAWEQSGFPILLRRLKLDVLHSPHYTMPEHGVRVPRVVTIHDMTFFDHPEWHEKTKVPVFQRAIKVAAARASALICVSGHTASRLRTLLSPQAQVTVVAHGVDHARFHPVGSVADDHALQRLGVSGQFVAFVGTIEPRKSVDHLVLAFDLMAGAHADLRLVLAGIDGWGVAAVDAAIAASRHGDRVIRTGYVSDDAVPALFRRAAAVAYPAYEEGFGLPALEALACGAPLVTTKGSVMEEVVKQAGLLVPPGDASALAGALDMLVRGDAGLGARRALGFEIAAAHTWEACARGHLAVYASVARSLG